MRPIVFTRRESKAFYSFFGKLMLAHNIYLNLDFSSPQISYKKNKAFVGYGNNCNMIKGLIKRRYWWNISEELSDECLFVWTQIKVNKIFQRQERGLTGKTLYKLSNKDEDQDRRNLIKTSVYNRKRHTIQINHKIKEKEERDIMQLGSLWNEKDRNLLLPFY